MRRRSVRYLTLCLSLCFVAPVLSQAQSGETIFGSNRKETLKAMRGMVDALGVRKKGGCLFCHVKVGSKPQFNLETPNKENARRMKLSFIDALSSAETAELFVAEDGDTTRIVAAYQTQGDSTTIHLQAVTADSSTYEKTIGPFASSTTLSCSTCHVGEVHVFAEMHDEH